MVFPHPANEYGIPRYPVRFNVRDFGAVGDGIAGRWGGLWQRLLGGWGHGLSARRVPASPLQYSTPRARTADDTNAIIAAIKKASEAAQELSSEPCGRNRRCLVRCLGLGRCGAGGAPQVLAPVYAQPSLLHKSLRSLSLPTPKPALRHRPWAPASRTMGARAWRC